MLERAVRELVIVFSVLINMATLKLMRNDSAGKVQTRGTRVFLGNESRCSKNQTKVAKVLVMWFNLSFFFFAGFGVGLCIPASRWTCNREVVVSILTVSA